MVELVDSSFHPQFEHSDFVQRRLILLRNLHLLLHGRQRNHNVLQLVHANIGNGCSHRDALQGCNALLAVKESLDIIRVCPAFIQFDDIKIAICQNTLPILHRCNCYLIRVAVLGQDEVFVLQAVFFVLRFDAGKIRQLVINDAVLDVCQHQVLHIRHFVRHHLVQLAGRAGCPARDALNDIRKRHTILKSRSLLDVAFQTEVVLIGAKLVQCDFFAVF